MTARGPRAPAPLSRRALLRTAGALAALVPLAACKKSLPRTCTATEDLTEEERAARVTLKYVDATPYAGKTCEACQHWIPEPEPGQCGGCKLLKGPIHPRGYCTVFVETA